MFLRGASEDPGRLPFLVAIIFLSAAASFSQRQPAEVATGSQPVPLTIGVVVDNSGSLRMIFDRVVNNANSVIDDMRPADEGFLVTFVDTPKIALRQEMTAERAMLKDAVENMFVEGGQTALLDAVVFASKYMAEQAKPGPGRDRILIMITDGDERVSSATIDEAVLVAKAAKVRIFVLGLYDEKFYSKTVDRLIRDTGGAKFVPKVPSDTATAVAGLLAAIRSK